MSPRGRSSWKFGRRRRTIARQVRAEIEHHVDERVERLVEQGYDLAAAKQEALRRFGDPHRVRARCERIDRSMVRRRSAVDSLDLLLHDLRAGWRALVHAPGFLVAMMLTLALGIGVNVAAFTVVDNLLWRPLPFHDPDALVTLNWHNEVTGTTFGAWESPRAAAWLERLNDYQVGRWARAGSMVRTDGATPERLVVYALSPGLLELLGARPESGRGFGEGEGGADVPAVVLLSHDFARSAEVPVGHDVVLNGDSYRVIGVMGRDFKFPVIGGADVYIPYPANENWRGEAPRRTTLAMRLPEARPRARVQERLDVLAAALAEQEPPGDDGWGWAVQLAPLDAWRANPDTRRGLLLLSAAAGGMLVIIIVNGVNLSLVQASARARQVAVRLALGATRGRMIRQEVVQSLLLATLAGIAAVLVAQLTLAAILALAPERLLAFSVNRIELTGRIGAFTVAVSAGTGLLLGMLPAVRFATRRGLDATLNSEQLQRAAPRRAARVRNVLVVGEIALSIVLLVGAGLFLRSFERLAGVDPGFRAENLAVLEASLLDPARYPDRASRAAALHRLKARLRALPGVEGVSISFGIPPQASFWAGASLEAEGREVRTDQPFIIPIAHGDEDFIDVLGATLELGRPFVAADLLADAPPVVIVDRQLADFLWPGENPLGHRFRVAEGSWKQVVGVVLDMKLSGRDDRRGTLDIIQPLRMGAFDSASLAIHTRHDPRDLFDAFRAVARSLDPNLPIELTLASRGLAENVRTQRFTLVLMSALAALSLGLAAVGTFGVLSHSVHQRRHELGVRKALGAEDRALRWMVVGHAFKLATVGIALGSGVALALGEVVRSLLFGIEPSDPVTFAVTPAVMAAAALAAAYLPARSATRVDPVTVLRVDGA